MFNYLYNFYLSKQTKFTFSFRLIIGDHHTRSYKDAIILVVNKSSVSADGEAVITL